MTIIIIISFKSCVISFKSCVHLVWRHEVLCIQCPRFASAPRCLLVHLPCSLKPSGFEARVILAEGMDCMRMDRLDFIIQRVCSLPALQFVYQHFLNNRKMD